MAKPAILLVLALAACDVKSDMLGGGAQPILPPVQSLDADVSFFLTHTPAPGGSTANWDLALERVTFVDTAINRLLLVPLATLRAAEVRQPSNQGDYWQWDFDTTAGGQAYHGSLLGGPVGVSNGWIMYLSAPGRSPPLSDYKWFSGLASVYGSPGYWLIEDPTGSSPDTATIQWSYDGVTNYLRFTSGSEGVFTYTWNEPYRQIEWVAANSDDNFLLQWNPTTGTGGVRLGGGSIVCWDAQQNDAPC